MWRYAPFPKFLADLDEHPAVDEILVIDNDVQANPIGNPNSLTKVRWLPQYENIFVNRAWNLGVQEARNDHLCILNDDLIFDLRVFDRVKGYLNRVKTGVVGLAPGDHPITKQPPLTNGLIDIIPWEGQHLWGFGMLMFVQKHTWHPIPPMLNMYYGDNWIFDTQEHQGQCNYLITNILHKTPYSVTSSVFQERFEVIERDMYPKEIALWKAKHVYVSFEEELHV